MISITYSRELGGHRVRAFTLESAWNTLARQRGAWHANATFTQGDPLEATYRIDLQGKDGTVIASGSATVTKA